MSIGTGIFDFNLVTREFIKDVEMPDEHSLIFYLDPSKINNYSFSAATPIEEISDSVYAQAAVYVTLNQDLSLDTIEVNLVGSIGVDGQGLNGNMTMLYIFKKN